MLITLQVTSNYMLFLEKIADMFEVIASVLPPYHQIYAICKRRMDGSQVDIEDERLTTLMSYAYADLVRMCLSLYRIFFRTLSGTCHQALVMAILVVPSGQLEAIRARIYQVIGSQWRNVPHEFFNYFVWFITKTYIIC
jgi:hypothetical protein